jgi:transposase
MTPKEYFESQSSVSKKRYDAMRDFFVNKCSAAEAAAKYGYTLSSFYTAVRDFRKHLKKNNGEDYFFKDVALGRKPAQKEGLKELVISLRKKNHSVEEIVGIANAQSYQVSYWPVYQMLQKEGFSRLPRRKIDDRKKMSLPPIKAPVAEKLVLKPQKFHSSNTGIFAFLPIIHKYGIHTVIERSCYPSTNGINRLSSILCFLALKLSNIKRYSHDDLWCMDRGMGLFAGLNVLPKASWLSSYSSRVDINMNLSFLKQLHHIWCEHGLLSDTSNLDFTTIPYWGDSQHLENNWSGNGEKHFQACWLFWRKTLIMASLTMEIVM